MSFFIILASCYLAGAYGEIITNEKGSLGHGRTHLDHGVHPLNVITLVEGTDVGGTLWNTKSEPGRRGNGVSAKLSEIIRSLPYRTLERLKYLREIFHKDASNRGTPPNYDHLLDRVDRLRPDTHGGQPFNYPEQHALLTPHIDPFQKPYSTMSGKRPGRLGKRLRKRKRKMQKKIRKALKKQRKNKGRALKKQIKRQRMLKNSRTPYRED